MKKRRLPKDINIIFEDKYLLLIEKPSGLLSIATEKTTDKTAYYIMTNYIRKGQSKSRKSIYAVHRLDQGTSGLLLFAKDFQTKKNMQENWEQVKKTYKAVVWGHLEEKQGMISSHLIESVNHKVYSTNVKGEGKYARTLYKVLNENKQFSFIEVKLITGRKNQIRVHLSEKGNPIVGDKKYGKDKGKIKLCLHAESMAFTHPVTKENLSFTSHLPGYFKRFTTIENTKKNTSPKQQQEKNNERI